MSKYMVIDNETENHMTYRRFSNPFDRKNYVVARGWKVQGDPQNSWSLHTGRGNDLTIPDDVTLLVGHNIKFDLLWDWNSEVLRKFFKRGGRIWDTMYAEYLINAMHPDYHMVALESIAESYGGTKKLDSVKAMWKMGYLTSQISTDMLIDYLVGTVKEGRNGGDIGNTEKVFLGQVKKAKAKKMLRMIQARMDGLLCTTEMEYNGLHIDMKEAKKRSAELEAELEHLDTELEKFIPPQPEGFEFNWSSNVHVSCLIFGGAAKYVKSAPYKITVDELGTEEWAYKTEIKEEPALDDKGQPILYKSGKRKGEPVINKVKVRGELKTKKQEFAFDFPGYTVPEPTWQLELKDGRGNPIYKTDADAIEELGKRDIPFLKMLSRRAAISKDLGTYYMRFDSKKNTHVGMLTCVMPQADSVQQWDNIIHHSLNHVNTVTSRLSSSDPNCQNISSTEKSQVKKMFTSRFKDGQMIEADFSQLEVIGQGMLSGDENLIKDICAKIDFHCKRVAAKHKISYDEAKKRCKDDTHPEYKFWNGERKKCKVFSFQRAYGAGAAKIANETGMEIEEVRAMIDAEDAMYPGVTRFNQSVEEAIFASAVPFKDAQRGFRVFRRGWWQAPTGTIFTWRSWDAMAWQKEKGITDSFMPTEIKNYPVQGVCGEIVQIIAGLLWRHFVANDNYNGKALLCNTVHDSFWIDSMKEVLTQVAKDVKRIMESVPEVLNKLYGMEVTVPFPAEVEIGDSMFDKHVIHI